MDEIEFRQWLPPSEVLRQFGIDENLVKSGNLTLVTFPKSLKSITISWSEKEILPSFLNERSEIYGKLYYDQKTITLNYIDHSHIITHSGNDVIRHTEEKNISLFPCKNLIIGKICQTPEFQKLEQYEGLSKWSIRIPYDSAVGGIYNQIEGTSISYEFRLTEGEMSCTYLKNYYADLEP
jgi:hypothetical protein